MSWRDMFLNHIGPGMQGGIALGDWLKLLRDNRFAIAPGCAVRAMSITAHACQNSLLKRIEHRRFGAKVGAMTIEPPLFLLGHWRSGTTHLHNLLAVDERWAFPNNYQALFPHAFLTTEVVNSPLFQSFLPPRRPMDNIEWTIRSPQEDEFALFNTTCISSYIGWVFQTRREFYDRYLTMREATDGEIERWKAALTLFLEKLTWKYRRPLVLKSPPHTCRIRLLLELFPNARFVHIHCNPYAVFQSSQHTFRVIFELHRLQRYRREDLDEWILRQYRTMYDAFFEERELIPSGRFHEICYEDLEADPMGQMRGLYEALDLPDFAEAESALQRYVDSIAGYQKNSFRALPDDQRQRVAERWRPCFDEWGYAV
ncbi:MAG: sulfotransferase [Pirellulales bacterium]